MDVPHVDTSSVERSGEGNSVDAAVPVGENVKDKGGDDGAPEEDGGVPDSLDGRVRLVGDGRGDEVLALLGRSGLEVDPGIGVELEVESVSRLGFDDLDLSGGLVDVNVPVELNDDSLLLGLRLLSGGGSVLLGLIRLGSLLRSRLGGPGLDSGGSLGLLLPLASSVGGPFSELGLPEGVEELLSKENESVWVGGNGLVLLLGLVANGGLVRLRSLEGARSVGNVGGSESESLEVLLQELDVDGRQSEGVQHVLSSVGAEQTLDVERRPELNLLVLAAGGRRRRDLVLGESEALSNLLHRLVERRVPLDRRRSGLKVESVHDQRVRRVLLVLGGGVLRLVLLVDTESLGEDSGEVGLADPSLSGPVDDGVSEAADALDVELVERLNTGGVLARGGVRGSVSSEMRERVDRVAALGEEDVVVEKHVGVRLFVGVERDDVSSSNGNDTSDTSVGKLGVDSG